MIKFCNQTIFKILIKNGYNSSYLDVLRTNSKQFQITYFQNNKIMIIIKFLTQI